MGFLPDAALANVYKSTCGLICASENEDFGISAVEAQAHGVPVIAYNNGGFKETIIPGKTGLLFDILSVNALIKTIKEFKAINFDPKDCYLNAKKFKEEIFHDKMRKYIMNTLYTS